MAINRDDLEGLYSSMADEGTPTAADLMSQYFGAETPVVEPGTERIPTQQEEQLQAFLEAARQQEALRAAQEGEARRALDEQIRLELERQAAMAAAQGPATNVAPPPPNTGLPPGVTQADLDAIAAQFRQAGYQDTPAINFTGDPNQPFFDMGTPEGGVDPRYFVEGLTSPAINTVRTEERDGPTRGEPDRQCPPNMEFDYELGRCVRKEVIEPPASTAPPVTTPPPTTAPPVTEPPATTPPPTTAPPRSCPPGYIYNPETRQCEAFLTSPPPTTAPPTTPPPTTAPPTTPPPTTAPPTTPPPTTRPPVTCPPGYALNAQGRCAPIDLGPCEPGYVRSTITGRCEPTTTGTPPPTTAPPATTAPPTTTGPGCKQGEIFSTTLGRCVPITTEAPATTPPPTTKAPPPGVITKFDPSAAMLEAYKRMFGTGVVNLGQSTPTTTGTNTSPVVSTPGIGTAPIPGTPTTGGPVPLPGFTGVTFTPGKPQYFGQTGGLLPGTVPSSYNPLTAYKGPNPVDVLQQNPNLTPSILGGLQGLGYFTDRLGNRILSPGGGFMSFAEGGPVSAAPPQTGRFYGSFGPEILNRPDRLQRALGTVNERPSLADMRYNDAQKVADINRLQAELYKKLLNDPESISDATYAAMFTSQANPGLRASAGGGFGGGTGGGLGYGGPTTYFPSVLNQDRKKPTVTVEEMPEADGYAEGGEAKKEDEEDNFDPSSDSAQAALRQLLAAATPKTKTEVAMSPNARAVRRTSKTEVETKKGKGISMSLEEAMASTEPTSSKPASEQLRDLMANTFNKPTLTARGPLAARRFAEGGEVDDSTPLQRRIYMESVSDPTKRTAPITERSMSARELEKLRKLIDIAERNPALSEKTGKPLPGVVDYAHQRMLMEQVDPMGSLPISMRDSDYNAFESGNLRNTLGQFTFERLPDGTLVVKDTYDYTGDVGERFNPLIRHANKKGVNRPVEIRLPAATKKKK